MSNSLSIIVSFVFLGLSGLLVMNSVKSVTTAYQRSQLLDQAEEEVQALRLRNLDLLQQLDYVSSPSYVEGEARNRLLYTKSGEELLVLPQTGEFEDDADSEDVSESGEDNADVPTSVDGEGWVIWWDLLRGGI